MFCLNISLIIGVILWDFAYFFDIWTISFVCLGERTRHTSVKQEMTKKDFTFFFLSLLGRWDNRFFWFFFPTSLSFLLSETTVHCIICSILLDMGTLLRMQINRGVSLLFYIHFCVGVYFHSLQFSVWCFRSH